MNIAIGGDHAGFEFKKKLVKYLSDNNHEVKDFGPFSEDSVDYPDFVHPVAIGVSESSYDFGILICGSGNGVAMTANKHQDIRAALCWENSLAALSRQHNNANIICIPARFLNYELAQQMTDTFLSTKFEGGRHQNRVNKISC